MIRIRLVLGQLGLLLVVLSGVQFVIAGWAGVQWMLGDRAESDASPALAVSAALGLIVGGLLWIFNRNRMQSIDRRDAMLLVALSWLVGAALSGLPYLLWTFMLGDMGTDHAFRSPVNCYFEAMSGLSTTGATVLTGIAELPRSLLLWRAMTHWLGGLGIVVLFVAVLPSLGAGGKKLFRVESPGPDPEGVHPHIRETARILWLIYVGLTVAQILALWAAGMSLFDAVCHTFATLATGGFSTGDASVGGYDAWSIHIIIIVFMFLAGVNFGLYYRMIRGRFDMVWRDAELRLYVFLLVGGGALVTASILTSPIVTTAGETIGPSAALAVREGLFTTVSIQTTTGFCTSDFNQWPYLAKAVLITLMFVGASAGSTGGGIKVIRIWITIKVILAEIERAFRPNVVRPVKVGGSAIDPALKLQTVGYVLSILVIAAVGMFFIVIAEQAAGNEIDITTAGTASVATLCNIGPGLNAVGAVENYAWFSNTSKLIMSVLMAIGRLEVFAIAVLFFPRFWTGD